MELRSVDRLYRASQLYRQLNGFLSSEGHIRLIMREYRNLDRRPRYENANDPETLLDLLRSLPWGDKVSLDTDAFDSIRLVLQDQTAEVDRLEQYAYDVASTGYDGTSNGVVDHAIASGLLLIQYCSLWYWFAKLVRYAEGFGDYRNSRDLTAQIVPACYAAACHNIIGRHREDIGFEKPKLENDPVLYLGVLCDELQRWDRFPSGEKHLRKLEDYSSICADSESIALKGVKNGLIVLCYPEKIAQLIVKSLDERLVAWNSIVEIGKS